MSIIDCRFWGAAFAQSIDENDLTSWDSNDIHLYQGLNKDIKNKKLFYIKEIVDIENYPNAYNQYYNEITLPLHTRLSDDDVDYIISNFTNIISK